MPSRGILLVDDEPHTRLVLQKVLELSGFKVFSAESACEGLAVLRKHAEEIGLLLTDIVMPRLSGFALARLATERCPHLRVLFITGESPQTISCLGDPGDIPILGKPFKRTELVAKVHEALGEDNLALQCV